MMNKKDTPIERIPYEAWSNSQLSIARHYGGVNINGKKYVLDYDNCEKKIQDGEIKYFPDLVLFSFLPKKKKVKNKKSVMDVLQSTFITTQE